MESYLLRTQSSLWTPGSYVEVTERPSLENSVNEQGEMCGADRMTISYNSQLY